LLSTVINALHLISYNPHRWEIFSISELWDMPVFPALQRLRQKDSKFEVTLSYSETFVSKKEKKHYEVM
jgi:hypothetical protein